MKNSFDDLLATLEEIRSSKYPFIPPDAIKAIALAQFENQDNAEMRLLKTQRIIDEIISKAKEV